MRPPKPEPQPPVADPTPGFDPELDAAKDVDERAAILAGRLARGLAVRGPRLLAARKGTINNQVSVTARVLENVLTTSETVIELAGLAQGSDYDYINASGSATVGGTLEIDLLDGYTPVAGDEFVFLTAADGVFGTFDQVLFPQISGLAFALEYAADSVTLNVATAVPLPTGAWLLLSALPLLAARARCV